MSSNTMLLERPVLGSRPAGPQRSIEVRMARIRFRHESLLMAVASLFSALCCCAAVGRNLTGHVSLTDCAWLFGAWCLSVLIGATPPSQPTHVLWRFDGVVAVISGGAIGMLCGMVVALLIAPHLGYVLSLTSTVYHGATVGITLGILFPRIVANIGGETLGRFFLAAFALLGS